MRLTRTQKNSPFLFQIVPLLDVIFALLVFFILSSTFLLQPGIAVNPPSSRFVLEPSRDPLIVSLSGGSASRLFFRDQMVSDTQLHQLLSDPALKNHTIVLKGDRAVPYERLMEVTNSLLEQGYPVVLATDTAKNPAGN